MRSALGIWLPKRRGYWGGPFTGRPSNNDPDSMRTGVVTHVAGAILWSGFSLASFLSLFSGMPQKSSRIEIVPGMCLGFIFTGFFLTMVGWLLDSRARDEACRRNRLSNELPGSPDERQRWIAVACGTVILLMMILALIFLS